MNNEEFSKVVAGMPALRHMIGEEYDPEKSEVVDWMLKQPGFKQWVFYRMRGTGRMVFDAEARTWRGQPAAPRVLPVLVPREKEEVEPKAVRAPWLRGRPNKYSFEQLMVIWPPNEAEAKSRNFLLKKANMVEGVDRMVDPTFRRILAGAVKSGKLKQAALDGRYVYWLGDPAAPATPVIEKPKPTAPASEQPEPSPAAEPTP